MKKLLLIAVLLFVTVGCPSRISQAADESDPTIYTGNVTCGKFWNQWTNSEKTVFLFGWFVASGVNDSFWRVLSLPEYELEKEKRVIAGLLDLKSGEDTQYAIRLLRRLTVATWPQGHRVGSMLIEMNAYCAKPNNADAAILGAILAIVEIIKTR